MEDSGGCLSGLGGVENQSCLPVVEEAELLDLLVAGHR